MNYFLKIFLIAVAVATAIPSFAVTDKEMEQARVMAAKHYLRYANNGSDYLDRLTPGSMAELQKSLKAKELENIKSFNAVATPKDYASWDKAKLIDYWSNTFFKSSGLKEDGKKCLGILGKNLAKIEVSAAPKPEQPKETPKEEKPAAPAAQAASVDAGMPAETVADSAGDLLADQSVQTAEVAGEAIEERPQKPSGTGWYIAILIVLLGVVVWLVMYAQKSMKETGQIVAEHKNGEKEIREVKKAAKEEVNKMRDQYAASVSAKNEEIRQLKARCESLEAELQQLRGELERNDAEVKSAREAQRRAAAAAASHEPERKPEESQPARRANALPPVVYLGYVNQRGLFVKASRSLNRETSVFRMDIPDGTHGTFRVVSDQSVLDRLLDNVDLWLAGGCDIENPHDADIATEIVTVSPGQAVFADNTCRVVKKARIKFI